MSGLWGAKGGEGPEGIAKEAHHERKGGRSIGEHALRIGQEGNNVGKWSWLHGYVA